MKKTLLRKLDLRRETIAPLKNDELDGVNGGQSVMPPTRFICPTRISWCQSDTSGIPTLRHCSVPSK